jgi:anti-sigma B factor antagonist
MIKAPPFEIASEPHGDGVCVRLCGELDIATAPQLEEAVTAALASGASELLIDLSGLSFVDSSGLRLFIILSDRSAREGWALGLVRPAEPSLSIFRLTGVEDSLPFVEAPGAR